MVSSCDDNYLYAKSVNISALGQRRVYIAAPFTNVSRPIMINGSLYDMIGPGQYRDSLLQIEQVLKTYQLDTFLPHRDVGDWGEQYRTAKEVVYLCTKHIVASEIFVGILGHSCGAHYEFGLAIGLQKRAIIIHCAEVEDSYMAQGFDAYALSGIGMDSRILSIQCEFMAEIGKYLKSSIVEEFLLA